MKESWIFVKFLLLIFLCSFYFFIHDRTAVVTQNHVSEVTYVEEREENAFVEKKQRKENKEKKAKKGTKKQTKEEKQLRKDWSNARKKYPNAIGWITIPKMKHINYPIMAANENLFYLTHNEKNQESAKGAIFLDESAKGTFSRLNLIHGHNMKSGEMFGDLDFYKRKEFLESHKKILTVQNGTVKEYQIFSVFILDANKEMIETGFANEEAFQSYIQMLNNRSKFPMNCPKQVTSILILNTCTYEFSNAHLLICAYERGDEIE